VFLLRESERQSILTIFNWTDKERKHTLSRTELRLGDQSLQLADVFAPDAPATQADQSLVFTLPPRSVRVIKILNTAIPASAPSVTVSTPEAVGAAKPATFSATESTNGIPALLYHWNFGDGAVQEGKAVTHTFTHAANYKVHLTVDGIDGIPLEKDIAVHVTGEVDTIFRPELYQRYQEKP
jgi:hypothetical protein